MRIRMLPHLSKLTLGNIVVRLLTRYMAFIGLLANAAIAVFLLYWVTGKVSDSEYFRIARRAFLGPLDGVEVMPIDPVAPGTINPRLKSLPIGVWLKIHQQIGDGPDDFPRQAHGGAAYDPVRGRLMLFGSDTHSANWDNTVRFFDMASLTWSSAYPADGPETYRVNADGIPVAGVDVEHPWAMHAFDAVEFDPLSDQLVVASHPGHMNPGKPWGVARKLWQQIKSHPTWAFRVGENKWRPLVSNGISFFPYGLTFDNQRRVLIGVKPGSYWEFDIDNLRWAKVAEGGPKAWHNAAAFDADHGIVVSFGTNDQSDDVWQYRVGETKGKVMSTPGLRPPGADSVPLAYHPGIGSIVALVEKKEDSGRGSTETWLYSVAADTWQHLNTATIPFAIGMNYDMVYDSNHELLTLVANFRDEPTAVWVLRLQ